MPRTHFMAVILNRQGMAEMSGAMQGLQHLLRNGSWFKCRSVEPDGLFLRMSVIDEEAEQFSATVRILSQFVLYTLETEDDRAPAGFTHT